MTLSPENKEELDLFICVHSRDINYLFEYSLRSAFINFAPRAVHIVSNDAAAVGAALSTWGLTASSITSDADWLTSREQALPGWYRQQVIKLRSYRICEGEFIVNLGADTVLLRPVTFDDLVSGGEPVLTWTQHRPLNAHWLYERIRLHYAAKLVGARPWRAMRYVDFINDFFCFRRDDLLALDTLLHDRFGAEPYATVLEPLGDVPSKEKHFGEWTLYATFVLDVLKRRPLMREAGAGFVTQVRDAAELSAFDFTSQVAHFVSKDLDRALVAERLGRLGLGAQR